MVRTRSFWIIAFVCAAFAPTAAGEARVDPDAAFGKALLVHFEQYQDWVGGYSGGETPVIRLAPTVVSVENGEWIYTLDVTGNECIRPQPRPAQYANLLGAARYTRDIHQETPPPIPMRSTRAVAAAVAGIPAESLVPIVLMREQVLIRSPELQRAMRTWSRGMARFSAQDDHRKRRFVQVIVDERGRASRINSNMQSPSVDALVEMLRSQVDPARPPLFPIEASSIAAFYDPSEYKFEVSTRSYLGEPFLELGHFSNPYTPDYYDLTHSYRVDTAEYFQSGSYYYFQWHWWNMYGQVGAADLEGEAFDLSSYGLVGGEPAERKRVEHSDGAIRYYPYAPGAAIEPRFYDDLERYEIVVFRTHGGRAGERFRFRRGIDTWVVLEPPEEPLGHGHLRHLILEGCGALTHIADNYPLLEPLWLPGRIVDGVRTVCGSDGGHGALDRTGWRFFGHYHKGEGIADAWAMAVMDEGRDNAPATVAYGATRNEALATLRYGRFDSRPASPTWAAASVWMHAGED